ncbi:MAG: hypothetical protein IPK82_06710 [Polyangiaceae bacterium]|nr:hypothetical protein [Polyangiaceae bacterium]
MPYLSQDQWKGTITPDTEDVATIDFTKTYEVVYQVNAWGTQDELRDDDNELSYEVTIYSSSACN